MEKTEKAYYKLINIFQVISSSNPMNKCHQLDDNAKKFNEEFEKVSRSQLESRIFLRRKYHEHYAKDDFYYLMGPGIAYQLLYTNISAFCYWVQLVNIDNIGGYRRFLFAGIGRLLASDIPSTCPTVDKENLVISNLRILIKIIKGRTLYKFIDISIRDITSYAKLWKTPSPVLLDFLVDTRETFKILMGEHVVLLWMCRKKYDSAINNWYYSLPYTSIEEYDTIYKGEYDRDDNKARVIAYCFHYRLRKLYRKLLHDFIIDLANKDLIHDQKVKGLHWLIENYAIGSYSLAECFTTDADIINSQTKSITTTLMIQDLITILVPFMQDNLISMNTLFYNRGKSLLEIVASIGTYKSLKMLKEINREQFSKEIVRWYGLSDDGSLVIYAAMYNSDVRLLKLILDHTPHLLWDNYMRTNGNVNCKLDMFALSIVYNSCINIPRYFIDNLDTIFATEKDRWCSKIYITQIVRVMSTVVQTKRNFFKRIALLNKITDFDVLELVLEVGNAVVFSDIYTEPSEPSDPGVHLRLVVTKLLQNVNYNFDNSNVTVRNLLAKDVVPFHIILHRTEPSTHWQRLLNWLQVNADTFILGGIKYLSKIMITQPLYLEKPEIIKNVLYSLISPTLRRGQLVLPDYIEYRADNRILLLKTFIGLIMPKIKHYKTYLQAELDNSKKIFHYVNKHAQHALSFIKSVLPIGDDIDDMEQKDDSSHNMTNFCEEVDFLPPLGGSILPDGGYQTQQLRKRFNSHQSAHVVHSTIYNVVNFARQGGNYSHKADGIRVKLFAMDQKLSPKISLPVYAEQIGEQYYIFEVANAKSENWESNLNKLIKMHGSCGDNWEIKTILKHKANSPLPIEFEKQYTAKIPTDGIVFRYDTEHKFYKLKAIENSEDITLDLFWSIEQQQFLAANGIAMGNVLFHNPNCVEEEGVWRLSWDSRLQLWVTKEFRPDKIRPNTLELQAFLTREQMSPWCSTDISELLQTDSWYKNSSKNKMPFKISSPESWKEAALCGSHLVLGAGFAREGRFGEDTDNVYLDNDIRVLKLNTPTSLGCIEIFADLDRPLDDCSQLMKRSDGYCRIWNRMNLLGMSTIHKRDYDAIWLDRVVSHLETTQYIETINQFSKPGTKFYISFLDATRLEKMSEIIQTESAGFIRNHNENYISIYFPERHTEPIMERKVYSTKIIELLSNDWDLLNQEYSRSPWQGHWSHLYVWMTFSKK